jgi:septal ring factor EnvC (AmiA/AmiB activator)
MAPDNKIERLRAERDDLLKANALLHALIGNREAEIERLRVDKDVIRSQERNAAYERDIAALEAEIEHLRAALIEARRQLECYELAATGEKYNSLQINAALEQKSP